MSLQLTYQISSDEQGMSLLNFLKKQEISKKAIVATKHRGGDLTVNVNIKRFDIFYKKGMS